MPAVPKLTAEALEAWVPLKEREQRAEACLGFLRRRGILQATVRRGSLLAGHLAGSRESMSVPD